jgi:PQQ-like domain
MQRFKYLGLLWAGVFALIATLVVSSATSVAASSSVRQWADNSLHVVGGPIIVGNTAVVIHVTVAHELEISSLDPTDGSVLWSRPFSASQITPGEPFTPIAIGNTVLVLSPANGSRDPSVSVDGVDARTGKTMWTVPQPLVLSDAPVTCGSDRYFCLPAFVTSNTTGLLALNPATGAPTGEVPGPLRNMAVAPPGSAIDSDLWQTNATAPTFLQTSPTGQQAWTRSVANLFGGSQFDPSYGWDFVVTGQMDIGSVGVKPIGKSEPLGGFKTVGISTTTGSVDWSTPGYFLCGGGLQFLTADLVCQYTGTAHAHGQTERMNGVKLTLAGLDPASGTTTWTERVLDAGALSLGTKVAFGDGSHLVVQLPSGRRVVLDVEDGSTSPVAHDEVFWCEQIPIYKVTTAPGASAHGKRASEPVFRACSASGAAVDGLPATAPSTVGVTIDGRFIWATPTGLEASRLAS